MYSAEQVDAMIKEWKAQGMSKPDMVVSIANACLDWCYVWGALGQLCTASIRRSYMNSSNIASGDINLIKKRCQILNSGKANCIGCKYYPEGKQTRVFDCRGFTRWVLSQVGITLTGGGATSQWNTASNWVEKGTIDTLPKDKVCCIFRYYPSTKKMEHTLLYDGQGNYIHCSGEVKKQKISSYAATHWAIPKGLYSTTTQTSTPVTVPTLAVPAGKAQVTGKNVALRLGPTTRAGIVARIATGTLVTKTNPPAVWNRVEYNGKQGYVMSQYIEKIDAATAKVTGKKLALRHGPTTNAGVITRINTGETVKYIDPPTDWLYVTYNGKTGYMMRQFLKEG